MTDVQRIKEKIDIISYISEFVPLKKMGRHFKACCPFHSERTPSFIVSPERGTWHCFGACNEGGDVIAFVQKWERVEFLEALKLLSQKAGITLSEYIPTDSAKLREKLLAINNLASELYHYLLTSHPSGKPAREYLETRSISEKTSRTFMLGYAPNSWETTAAFLKKKGYSISDIVQSGLVIEGRGGRVYDRFRRRIMFTLKDHRGNIIGFSGRKIPPETGDGGKYINTPETAVYVKGNVLYGLDITKDAIKQAGEAVVVEGEFDLLSSFQSGVANVVAIKGSAFTQEQVTLLARYVDRIILALDSDFAGNEAARRSVQLCEQAGLMVRALTLPVGKDPAECIAKGAHIWKKAIKEALPIYDFIIQTTLSKYPGDDAFSKKRIADEVLPFLSHITNPILESHYTKLLSDKLHVTEESIMLSLRKLEQNKSISAATSTQSQPPTSATLEEHFLALLVQSQNPSAAIAHTESLLSLDELSSSSIKTVITLFIEYMKTQSQCVPNEFAKSLPSELLPTFDRAFLIDLHDIISQPQAYDKELDFTISRIKKLSLRRKIQEISTNIAESQTQKQEEETQKLQHTLRTLISQMRDLEQMSSAR